jgi:histidinol-phosphate aminotransferase
MFKPEIKKIAKYVPSTRFVGSANAVFLDWNESPFDLPASLKDRLIDVINNGRLNQYPIIDDSGLAAMLAKRLGLREGSVAIYPGSDAAIQELLSSIIWSGRRVYFVSPDYMQAHQYVTLFGGDLQVIEFGDPFNKFPTIMSLSLGASDVLYFSNPCNPTGALIERQNIVDILKTGVTLIVDEAYVEFAKESSVDLCEEFPNLIVVRTFSKAYGMAGLRVGYLCSQPDNIKSLSCVRNVKQLTDLAKTAVAWTMENEAIVQQRVAEINSVKAFVFDRLKSIKALEVFPSHGNFILVRTDACHDLLTLSANNGFLLRDRQSQYGMGRCFRVSIGALEQMTAWVELVESFFRGR